MMLPEGSGMFSELFNSMENEIKKNPKRQVDYKDAPLMRDYEKDISFLNRFFVYKKTSTRNADKLTKVLLNQLPDEDLLETEGTMLARETVAKAEEMLKPKAKKLKQKIMLQGQEQGQEPEQAPKASKAPTKRKVTMKDAPIIPKNVQIVIEPDSSDEEK
jgi:hypothetical protein